MRGRRPKPEGNHFLHGTRRHRPAKGFEAPSGRVICPRWLPKDAKAEWRRLAPGLIAQGMLTPLDVGCFAAYCIAAGNVAMLTRTIDAEGATYQSGDLVKRHPCVPMLAAAMRDVRLLGELFGLSPLSRQRIDAPPVPTPEDPFDRFLSDVAGTG